MAFAALLTDLDGTLVHSQDPICEALEASFRHVGAVPPGKQAILDMFGLPVEVMLTTLSEVREDETDRIAEFIAEYKRQYPVKMVKAKLIAHAEETLQKAFKMGLPICLITSERKQNAQFILHELKLDRYIHYLISRDDVEHFKPDPEPLLKAAALVGQRPADCVYIGESPFDIQAGVAAGVYTVAVPSGNWPLESLLECSPHRHIMDIQELQEILLA
ncbi:HAD family hydrolase [uncultured Dysosmobacter sp.]|uniref:HAD family hydrolase n=1 Tax=uncultured Dysosmobacter sp. TaxID=2591384 RepID=UPI0026348E32|nr:HAD hydrolase-like protein [uncultured Dysosmobacter sp.]